MPGQTKCTFIKGKFLNLGSYLLLITLYLQHAHGQPKPDTANVKPLLEAAAKYNATLSPEKLYLNFDKPYYAAGDTAWFKAYVLAGNSRGSTKSVKLYVELFATDGELIQRLVIPVFDGLAQGYIPLDEKKMIGGNYTLRAYTNWLQNLGSDHFFYKQFNIGKLSEKTWLLTEQHKTDANSNRVTLAMRFNNAQGRPLITHPITAKLMDSGKPTLRSEMTTGVDGFVTGKFTIPAKANRHNLSIQIDDPNDKAQHIVFPFYPLGTDGDIDLQFMPEGGNLVAGLFNRIGFKAIGEDGMSREVNGVITDSKGNEVANLQSVHSGMGNFVLVPQAGEAYTAKITVNGKQKNYSLPAIKSQGMTLRVDAINHPEEIYVYISATSTDAKSYSLITRSGEQVYFGMNFTLNADGYFNARIPKNKFPTGIVNLTILNHDNIAVCERNIFLNQHDALQVKVWPEHASYHPNDKIALNVQAITTTGKGIQGSFSLSVTDDSQVKSDIYTDNIQSHILLTSELRGHIENPGWYFTEGDEKQKEKALDNLLLSQGWVSNMAWNALDKPLPAPRYQPEADFSVSGNLKNLLGKPAGGLKVSMLASGKQLFFMDTVSDNNGRFVFRDLPLSDSVGYTIKLHNGHDKSVSAEIKMDEFKPSTLQLPALLRLMPWNVNADTVLLNYAKREGERNRAFDNFDLPANVTQLKEVVVKDKRIARMVNDDYAVQTDSISEKTLIAANKITLLELLERELKGTLKESTLYARRVTAGPPIVNIEGKFISAQTDNHVIKGTKQFVLGILRINDIIVDGQSLGERTMSLRDITETRHILNTTKWGGDENEADENFFKAANALFTTLSADDIKSIKVFRGQFLSLLITTRSNAGLTATSSIGTYAFRPLPIQVPKVFYAPKYNVKSNRANVSSTIYWEPNLITDVNGSAKLSFFAAGHPGSYTVIIEGTDMQGHFGVTTGKIIVSQDATQVK